MNFLFLEVSAMVSPPTSATKITTCTVLESQKGPRPQMDLLSERKTINSSTTNTATTSGNQQTVSNGRLKNISEATVLGKQGKADQGGSGVQVPGVPAEGLAI